MTDTIIIEGAGVGKFLDRIDAIMSDRIKEAVAALAPNERPDDLLNYYEIMRIYNMSSFQYVSEKVNKAGVEKHMKDGVAVITRACAEQLFRKTPKAR